MKCNHNISVQIFLNFYLPFQKFPRKFIDNGEGKKGKVRRKDQRIGKDCNVEDKCGTNRWTLSSRCKRDYYRDSRSIAFQRLCFVSFILVHGNSVLCISRRRHRLAPSHLLSLANNSIPKVECHHFDPWNLSSSIHLFFYRHEKSRNPKNQF